MSVISSVDSTVLIEVDENRETKLKESIIGFSGVLTALGSSLTPTTVIVDAMFGFDVSTPPPSVPPSFLMLAIVTVRARVEGSSL